MSTGSGRAFIPVLRTVGDRLRLPLPVKTRILRELDADLEDLTTRLVHDGVALDEARRRAREALVPDQTSLEALVHLHEPLYRHLTRSFDADRLRRIERWALALATALVVVVSAIVLAGVDLVTMASPFQWPVMAVGWMMFALGAAKSFEIWIKGNHSAARRGLRVLPALAVVALAVGIGGAFIDLYTLAAMLETAPDRAVEEATAFLIRDAVLVATALLAALAGAFVWFALSQWLTHIEDQHRQVLGLDAHNEQRGY
jgi:hypothetical protein